MTEQQSQSAVGFQHKTRKQKPRKDPNAPFIREKLELPEGTINCFCIPVVPLARVR